MAQRDSYPLYIKLFGDIGDGIIQKTERKSEFIDSFGAITVEIKVDSCNYPKDEVYKAVKETVLKAAEYFQTEKSDNTTDIDVPVWVEEFIDRYMAASNAERTQIGGDICQK